MTTEVLQIDSENYLVFGLRWVVLDALEAVSVQLNRERQAGSRWMVRYKNAIDENLGLSADLPDSTERLSKSSKIKLVSGAAQIAAHPKLKDLPAVLVMIEEPGVAPDPAIVAMVGLISGNIVLDTIQSPNQIFDKREWFFEECSKRNIDTVVTAGVSHTLAQPELPLTWEEILSVKTSRFFNQGYRIKPLDAQLDPKTLLWVVLAALAVMALIFFIWLWGYWREIEAKREQLTRELSITPLQRYLDELPNKLKEPVWYASQMDEVVAAIDGFVPRRDRAGWLLTQIDCVASTQSCQFEWGRILAESDNKAGIGTMASFRDSLPTQEEQVSATNPANLDPLTKPTFNRSHVVAYTPDKITLSVQLKVKAQGAPARTSWLPFGKEDVDEPSRWMRWQDLGVEFTTQKPEIFGLGNLADRTVLEREAQTVFILPWTIKEGPFWHRDVITLLPPSAVIDKLSWKLGNLPKSQKSTTVLNPAQTPYKFSAYGRVFLSSVNTATPATVSK